MLTGTSQPTFWLLDQRTGWRSAAPATAPTRAAVAGAALGLATLPGGPLGLGAADGSLGGLTLPRGMAMDATQLLYLLGLDDPWVKRFDPASRSFRQLPGTGGRGRALRRLWRPANLAVAGPLLYLADRGNRRVQVFDLANLALVHVWGQRDVGGPWKPQDVASDGRSAYVLDHQGGRVYRHTPGGDALVPVLADERATGRWTRLAVDRDGRLYLLDPRAGRLDVHRPDGSPLGTAEDPGQVRDRFDPPVVRLDQRGRFCLPESLARPCDRRRPDPPPAGAPLASCRGDTGLVFDRSGQPADRHLARSASPALYEREGRWTSEPLDSAIPGCPWHRIELDVARLPPGTRLEVRSFTATQRRSASAIAAMPAERWDLVHTAAGELPRPDPPGAPPRRPPANRHEALVRSEPGQYLWLRVDLAGDGDASPAIRAIRVHYPRRSYLEHLPAIYASQDASRDFLERYLSIVQTEWDSLDRKVAAVAGLFDPAAVPEEAIDWLAGWLALPLEPEWDAEAKRRLLAEARRVGGRRGTVAALRSHLRIYLRNLAGVSPEQLDATSYPGVVEAFRERRLLLLSSPGTATLGTGAPLWSPQVVARLQLGTFATEGQVRLVSTGDPQHDVFDRYAHRFAVFVPAAWVRGANHECMLRRAIDEEKPAHTAYDLCLVEPRMRVGVQAILGLDTIVGAYPTTRLACVRPDGEPPPGTRLGHDTVLAGGRPRPPRLDGVPAADPILS